MSAPSLTTRLLRSTVFVALVTVLAGAATASLIARGLWQAHERRALGNVTMGLAGAVEREAGEEGEGWDAAAAEALRESVTGGYRAEVWRGNVRLAANPPGPPLGPPAAPPPGTLDAWLLETRSLPDGLTLLVAAPRERVSEVLRIFGWSLVLSVPVCVALSLLIGRLAGLRAARSLIEFKDRIASAQPFEPLPRAAAADVREVAELEVSFGDLWDRLRGAVSREIEFAANSAHELRTPLTRIRLHAERARDGQGAAASEELSDLMEETDRMVRLVDSLLVLSRDAAAGIPVGEAVNVSDVVASMSRRVFRDSPAPEIDAPDEALVRGDEALLEIAVLNLLDNARKFSEPGRPPRVAVHDAGALVRLVVTSPGTRIPPGQEERLFDRFYRSPEARATLPGHGLGLPLARHVARLHGGDVRCVSQPGEDARFEMLLPAWRPQPDAGSVSTEPGYADLRSAIKK